MSKYSGKAKDVLFVDDDTVRIVFRDSISAFDGAKKDELQGKGEVNCSLSSFLFELLNRYGFPTHFIKREDPTTLLCRRVSILPVEVVCRNFAAGSFCRRYGTLEGKPFSPPLIEFFVKDDALHDPLIDRSVAINLGLITPVEASFLESITLAVNSVLSSIFDSVGLTLVDFKLEFGRASDGSLLIADEISGDTMRLWDKTTGDIKDKDRYRKGLGNVVENYLDVFKRLSSLSSFPSFSIETKFEVIVKPKDTVLDPAGEVTLRSLHRLGYTDATLLRLGKFASLRFRSPLTSSLLRDVDTICSDILSNPLIEDYSFDFTINVTRS